MSDNRKYYYLKLKENYFDDDSIVLLESMQDGVLYSNILLKLYLKSLKHGGRLQLDENIPYTAQMIATITRQQIGTVERALQIFLKLGLVEVLDSGTFYMSNIELLIGQSSTEAERKRAARLQNKTLSAPRTNGGHLSDIRPPEIEIGGDARKCQRYGEHRDEGDFLVEKHRHDDGNQHRIDKQDGGRNARIHVVIALEEKERGKGEQQPHYRQRKYIRLLQRKGLFLHLHQDAH